MAYAEKLHRRLVEDLNRELGTLNYQTMMIYQPMPKLFGEISQKSGGNMLGLEQQEHNAILFTGSVIVKTSKKDFALAQTRLATLTAKVEEYAASIRGSNKLVYMNYASQFQDSLASYGKKNVEFIRKVAEKYDPSAAFQKRFVGGFKVSKVDV